MHTFDASPSADMYDDKPTVDDKKPKCSYISLIATAILSSPEKRLVLSDIYAFILENFTYFCTKGSNWRNTVRHNLSINRCFLKADLSPNRRGHYWLIHPDYYDNFIKGNFTPRREKEQTLHFLSINNVSDEAENLKVEQLNSITISQIPFPCQICPPLLMPTFAMYPGPREVKKSFRDAPIPNCRKRRFLAQQLILGGKHMVDDDQMKRKKREISSIDYCVSANSKNSYWGTEKLIEDDNEKIYLSEKELEKKQNKLFDHSISVKRPKRRFDIDSLLYDKEWKAGDDHMQPTSHNSLFSRKRLERLVRY